MTRLWRAGASDWRIRCSSVRCGPPDSRHFYLCPRTDQKVKSMLYILLVGGSLYAGFIFCKRLAQAILIAVREFGPGRS